ncbi:MAG: fused MFS/spermidine synthase, partial [Calditrichia bacterium]
MVFRFLILLLFLISGFTGLVYEVVWTRIFGLVFGNTTLAISTVLSAYMFGLAAGSRYLGRIAGRSRNHLKMYALLEGGVGIFAVMVILLMNPINSLIAVLHPVLLSSPFWYFLIKFAIAFLVMFPATFLMGGTLPVLSYVYIHNKQRLGGGVGALYSINTLGAVAGTLFTAFFLIRTLGVRWTVFLAVAMNLLIAGLSFALAAFRPSASQILTTPEKSSQRISSGEMTILLAAAVSGFTALAYEVLWSRVLVFLMTNSVYAFAVILATFLSGIAIGSFLGGKVVDRVKNPRKLFGWIQLILGVCALAATVLLIRAPLFQQQFLQLTPTTTWLQLNLFRFFLAFTILLLPTVLLGASFPVAAKILLPDLSNLGRELGNLYFFNTLGSVLGSFLTGFLFISWLGTATTIFLMVILNLAVGGYLLMFKDQRIALKSYAYGAVILLILAASTVAAPKNIFRVNYSSVETGYPLVDYREGIEGTVTVHQAKLPMMQHKRIDVDGLNVAGNSFM